MGLLAIQDPRVFSPSGNVSVEINGLHEDYTPLEEQIDPRTGSGTIDEYDDMGRDIGHVDVFNGDAVLHGPEGQYEGSVTEPSPGTFQYDK